MKLLSDTVYRQLLSEAREAAGLRAAMAELLTENTQLKEIAHTMTTRLNEGTPTISALSAQFKAMARRAGELATLNVRLAHVAEQAELVARQAVEQSEQAMRVAASEHQAAEQLAKEVREKGEVADLLAETLQVVLDYPDRLEECGRNSLVAYRCLILDTKEGG